MNLTKEGVAIPAAIAIVIAAVVGLAATQFGWTESIADSVGVAAEAVVVAVIAVFWAIPVSYTHLTLPTTPYV